MTGLSVFKVKNCSFLIVNFPLFIGRDMLHGETKKEWLLHFSGYYFQTKFACLIWSVKQKSILPCLLGMVQLYRKLKYCWEFSIFNKKHFGSDHELICASSLVSNSICEEEQLIYPPALVSWNVFHKIWKNMH